MKKARFLAMKKCYNIMMFYSCLFQDDSYIDNYISTIGVDFVRIYVKTSQGFDSTLFCDAHGSVEEFKDIVFAYGVSDELSFVLEKDSLLYERHARWEWKSG
ncbi:PREDICTED: uncharacterized protein LOC109159368 isoform X2 [Ipomoea nil]|uniref:uncharacterized protein LOC109159368 isoform X2 n=1 Tax=Ipomoea nil TaxID=35883 RepID=UPI000901ECEE|nr:PREDICTED: uncharacterized protein LOC109159368 isoform X2 [Ipomoea nil]